MKFVVLGTTEFTLCCTRALLDSGFEVSALIALPSHMRLLNSADVSSFAQENNISYHEIEDINSPDSIRLIKSYSPDFIFSAWPHILKKEILNVPRIYTIGTHPTALPFNRGRHPLHWLIALGIKETKLSFFVMDEGIDTGRLLLQIPFKIKAADNITDVIQEMNTIGYKGTKKLCRHFLGDPVHKGVKQEHRYANVWRKRTPYDVMLDMRMSKGMILRTVQSFKPPYPCAILIFENHILKISNVVPVDGKLLPENYRRFEHGKILGVTDNKLKVKVDDGVVELECKDTIPPSLRKAKYIYPPAKYLVDWPKELPTQLTRNVSKKEELHTNGQAVAIVGYYDGSAGQVETWFEEVTGYKIACFVCESNEPLVIDIAAENRRRISQRTEYPRNQTFKGRPLITSLNWINELKKIGVNKVLLLTPNNRQRLKQVELCRKNNIELVSAIHPTVKILGDAIIEPGVWINAGSIIGYKAKIESGVIINTGVQIDHHNELKQCCQVDPAVITAGYVTLRECCHVHTGTIVINRKEVGNDAIIGAGAVIIKDIPPLCTAVGVPARVIKSHQECLV